MIIEEELPIIQAPTDDPEIEEFLQGHNPLKYVIAVEPYYQHPYAEVIIHDPAHGKFARKINFNPFVFMKDLSLLGIRLYAHDENMRRQMISECGISFIR